MSAWIYQRKFLNNIPSPYWEIWLSSHILNVSACKEGLEDKPNTYPTITGTLSKIWFGHICLCAWQKEPYASSAGLWHKSSVKRKTVVYWCLSASSSTYVCSVESVLFRINFFYPSLLFSGLYFQRVIFFPVWNYLILNNSIPAGLAVIPSPSSISVFIALLLVQDEAFPNLKCS